ncbi:hypothetical protein C8F01DRAFT_1187731 [Mycena amicta]|nr:hypothetical protein C8F01DRAFT_1187731 [Mycena amicta]
MEVDRVRATILTKVCRWRGRKEVVPRVVEVGMAKNEAGQRSNARAECASGLVLRISLFFELLGRPFDRWRWGSRILSEVLGNSGQWVDRRRMHYHGGQVCVGPILLAAIHQLQAARRAALASGGQSLRQPGYESVVESRLAEEENVSERWCG